MKNTAKNTIKTALLAAFAFFFIISFGFAKTASADKNFNLGEGIFGDSYYYDEYFPSYSYDSYYPEYSYDSYYPSYDYYGYDYSYPSYSYSYPSYSYGGYSYPTYTYTPYTYNTPSYGTGGANYQYVYSSNENENSNANSNTNTITNTFNPVNNNDAKINLIVYGGGTGSSNNNYEQNLEGNCVINPSVAYVGQDISFYANATGGVGGYSYSWTGTDGIYSSSQSFTGRYSYPGYKTATVTIRSGSQSITRTCNVNVNGVAATQSNVTVIRDQNLGTPVAGVFLNQVPETGISFGLKMTLFATGLTLWSLFAAYMIARRKNPALVAQVTENVSGVAGAISDKIAAFKLANMSKKGIIG